MVGHLKTQGTPEYLTAVTADDEEGEGGDFGGMAVGEEDVADL